MRTPRAAIEIPGFRIANKRLISGGRPGKKGAIDAGHAARSVHIGENLPQTASRSALLLLMLAKLIERGDDAK